jgi:tetratricopeptide (TPR) repeat protein
VPEHRRSAALWRQLGDLRREAGDSDGAVRAWQTALQHDRTGRHLTLGKLGDAHRQAGRWRQAERTYAEALEFRRRRFLSDDRHALAGLLEVNRHLGREDRVRELRERLAGVRGSGNDPRADVA